ncbi:hypothetical protein IM697_05455 [Streptomyces ferrugineus]|uniref:Integral membrane protein n=1 Tax=Streptomyces ferrugineus TaxID=1413221 RepID=A0A7M2SRH8_9ACTN|nr:hypothetical protein [Streptomyces ferrugineus]QOV37861.1 hypothetical protein IM697_05455 [Streptomyces ferrugineus]
MHGHGYPQPVNQPPPTGWLVFLRVVFVVISVLSFGLLMWTMMLRLAIVTRRALDWWLFAASIVVEFLGLYLMGSEPGEEIHTAGGWIGLALVLGGIVASVAYYLSADIRHFHQLRFPGYRAQRPPAQAYGYPQPQSPYTATTAPQSPTRQAPTPHTPIPQTPAPPPPQRPAPARIDQVRAELDELSDYLRKHDGNPEGGR